MNKIGLYLWGGPGIIDLLKIKYPLPKIDANSHMRAYDFEYLAKAKDILGITDLWVTFSWGFSNEHEQAHRDYIIDRLFRIKALGFTVHAYIQGFNLVTADFNDQDVFCRDPKGKLLPYSRGRSFICPNNPASLAIIKNRVALASKLDFDGIYIDNMQFGLHPFFVSKRLTSFFGCSCRFCQNKFKAAYGYDLPLSQKRNERVIKNYLDFRGDSVARALAEAQKIAKERNKLFGVNLYDFERHNSRLYFGYDLNKIDHLLDYYLLENHSFNNYNKIDNSYLKDIVKDAGKPVFVLSYKNGIGCEKGFGQKQLDLIYSEASRLGYCPCIKGSEYKTRGIWHVLALDNLQPPNRYLIKGLGNRGIKKRKIKSRPILPGIIKVLDDHYPRLMRLIYNNRLLNISLHHSKIYTRILRSVRNYEI